jgi:hypothetical protein
VRSDGKVELSEFILLLNIENEIKAEWRKPKREKYRELTKVQSDITVLVALMAIAGGGSSEQKQKSFAAGLSACEFAVPSLSEFSRVNYGDYKKALEKVGRLLPLKKRDVVTAMVMTAMHDQKITLEEYSLLQLLTKSMDCPLPPIVDASME